jgi:hypothetical protein
MTRNLEYLFPSVNLSLAKKYMKALLFFMSFTLFYFNFILLYENKITNDTWWNLICRNFVSTVSLSQPQQKFQQIVPQQH